MTQLVYGEADRVYTIRYQMGQYKDGSWRLRNLIIETINLGEIYRNQFVALAKEANEDLDLVIAQWNDTISVSLDGSHVDITVVAAEFEGLRPVARQQRVYAPLATLIADGTLHAVNITAQTP